MIPDGYQFIKDTKQELLQRSQLDVSLRAIDVQQKNSELYEKMITVLKDQVREIKEQNDLLRQQLEDANVGFRRSMKFNIAMLIVSIISAIVVVVSAFI